ncbi:MAG: nitrate reductase associated protein [Nodosilinea sp.]
MTSSQSSFTDPSSGDAAAMAAADAPIFFQFEADFVDSLRCIPMQVRYKLDTCGIKLKLPQWNQLDQAERSQLTRLPCQTPAEIQAYRSWLVQLIYDRCQVPAKDLPVDPQPEWLTTTAIPSEVQEKAQEAGAPIALDQWAALAPLQRFALIKLSRSNHENKNFFPALQELGLA